MNPIKIYDQIDEEYGHEIAILALVGLTMNYTKSIKNRHLKRKNKGLYTAELRDSIKELLFNCDDAKIEKALQLVDSWYDYELGLSMQGLGGCVQKSLKEIIGDDDEY